jgi:RNA polymerase sigma-70 factor (ECF subfamily)
MRAAPPRAWPGIVASFATQTCVPITSDEAPETPPNEASLVQGGYRYALALTHRVHEAEDLVHDAWLGLCRRYGKVDSPALLIRAIRNRFIDRCRRARVVAFEPLDATEADPPAAPVGALGLSGDVEAMLAQLRPAEREAIFLHHVEGFTAEEIATLTAQPRGTVLSLLSRAFVKLRALSANPAY